MKNVHLNLLSPSSSSLLLLLLKFLPVQWNTTSTSRQQHLFKNTEGFLFFFHFFNSPRLKHIPLPPDPSHPQLKLDFYSIYTSVCVCVYVHVCACVFKCFVLYVIYSQHCKHTETIIHVLALIHWIWLTSLEHHKSSNDLGWTRTQWRIKIEGFWRASGGPFKVSSYRQADVPVGLASAVLEKKLRRRAAAAGTEWVLFPSSEKNTFLVKEPSWLWRGWIMDQHKREGGKALHISNYSRELSLHSPH